jgi:branched-chain amino acid transport system substrate-binding protein
MKGIVPGLAAAAVLLAAQVLAQDKVKIGFISTFTGGPATIGQDMRDSFELALDHMGRKMGGKEVEVIYEDDGFKPETGKQKTDKLVQSDKVDFVAGYIWSNVLLASYKSVFDAETFLISANAGPHQLAGEACSEWFFSTSWQNDQTPEAMGALLNQRKIQNLYIISPNYAAGRDMAEGVKRTFKGKVIGEDYTKWPDQLDFSAELSKARAAKPDAVFVFFPGRHGVQILQQYAQSGLTGKIPFYSTYTIDATTLPLQKELALGAISTQSWVQDLPNEVNKRYVADYLKKHGRYPSFYGAQSYDAAMLIASAVNAVSGDVKNKAGMRTAMRKAQFPNTRGDNFRYGNNHFPIQNFYAQEVVKDSEGRLTYKTVATVFKDYQDAHASKCPMKW